MNEIMYLKREYTMLNVMFTIGIHTSNAPIYISIFQNRAHIMCYYCVHTHPVCRFKINEFFFLVNMERFYFDWIIDTQSS